MASRGDGGRVPVSESSSDEDDLDGLADEDDSEYAPRPSLLLAAPAAGSL